MNTSTSTSVWSMGVFDEVEGEGELIIESIAGHLSAAIGIDARPWPRQTTCKNASCAPLLGGACWRVCDAKEMLGYKQQRLLGGCRGVH